MVQQWIAQTFADTRRAADHHERAFFRVGTCNGIYQAQAAHVIGDAHCAHAVDARIGVGGVAGVEFVAGPDHPDGACF